MTVGQSGPPTISVTYPSGVTAGDLLIIVSANGIFIDELPGWHAVGPGHQISGRGGTLLFWKIAAGGESGTLGPLDVAQQEITTSTQETTASIIMFAYESWADAEPYLLWSSQGPLTGTFTALTGQQNGYPSIVPAYAFGSTGLTPGGSGATVNVDADLTVDARVSSSQAFTGPVTGDQTDYVEYLTASRPVTVGTVPQYDMSSTDAFDARFWRTALYEFEGVEPPEIQPYWGVLVTLD